MIVDWLKKVRDRLELNEPENTFDRIRKNRENLFPFWIERLQYRASDIRNQEIKDKAIECLYLLEEHYRYFEDGRRSPENIDTLPDKLKTCISELIALLEV